jgi:hypothetical protein
MNPACFRPRRLRSVSLDFPEVGSHSAAPNLHPSDLCRLFQPQAIPQFLPPSSLDYRREQLLPATGHLLPQSTCHTRDACCPWMPMVTTVCLSPLVLVSAGHLPPLVTTGMLVGSRHVLPLDTCPPVPHSAQDLNGTAGGRSWPRFEPRTPAIAVWNSIH